MSREEILARTGLLSSRPVAFQALWEGDSSGWFIRVSAVTNDGGSHYLGILSGGGDLRIFNGQVPPWPEAEVAKQLGSELAEHYGASFYFPSPNHPEDDCPEWHERDKGTPCRRCDALLLPKADGSRREVCFFCHLDEEREERESKWTPEQRAGRRCHICGNPATTELNGGPACERCFNNYEVYDCAQCNTRVMIPRAIPHTTLCQRCELLKAIDALSPVQRQLIREAMGKGHFAGEDAAIEIMNCSLYEAKTVVQVLSKEED